MSTQNQGERSSSSWETIIIAVPQGSILGTLLFIIYINDLPCGIYYTAKPVIYADNTSVLITAKNVNALQIKAKTALEYTSR
jgi:mannose/fructose/N-acetylgalactosamine-specific phosphotransferase system component IID